MSGFSGLFVNAVVKQSSSCARTDLRTVHLVVVMVVVVVVLVAPLTVRLVLLTRRL